MPKVQFIDPKVAREAGEITFNPIPVNQYNKTIAEEKSNFSNDDFLRIYHDMVVIREFETMLNLIKTTENTAVFPMITRDRHISLQDRKLPLLVWLIHLLLKTLFLVRTGVMVKSWQKD
jgi:hypothetical protein